MAAGRLLLALAALAALSGSEGAHHPLGGGAGAAPALRLRGGGAATPGEERYRTLLSTLRQDQLKALPWYLLLEESPYRLGSGPYGLPYSDGRPNVAKTEFFSNPKSALGKQLYKACSDGALDAVDRLLKIGVDPDSEGKSGISCLTVAAHNGHVKVVERLILGGANVKARNGPSAVEAATDAGQKDVLKAIDAAVATRASAVAAGGEGVQKVVKLFP
mmetsp:Transcript_29370/g.73807  ORF Transcript_29370/g.73807 Transcript_29370/m.73807 type:complete len:218 (-) Transcript_29370:14-667(-)